ncbi:MAG: hypothetical protein J4N81_14610, partial [Chloroflexi bacterium]|nr:hypothetical protein [Chloroflexota bacterium]
GGGFLSRFRNRGNKGDEDDEEAWEDPEDMPPPASRGQEDEEGPEEPAVQVVRLEGVPDVHPVGGGGDGGMTPPPQNTPSPGPSRGGQSPAPSDDAASEAQSPPDDTPSPDIPEEPAEKDSADQKGLGISLKDIFEEEIEVDETLRDLAESMDDIPVGQLAEELREFLADLEKIMGTTAEPTGV